MSGAAAVTVDRVSKVFRAYTERNQTLKATVLSRGRARYEEKRALDDVSLEVATGTTFGLVGDNGSGKSTLLKCLARILVPDHGDVRVRGKVAALLELGSGFHPELTGRQNVYLNGAILGMNRRELERRFDDIVGFAGLEDVIDQPVRNYSSGMYVRLGFSVATNVDPEVLLVDEVLAVGDATFQRRCLERIDRLRRDGRTVVVVSHASEIVRNLCDEVAWLEHGRLIERGPTPAVLDRYLRSGVEDRAEVAQDPDRWGTGEVLIDSVEVLDNEGTPTTKVGTGSACSVRVTWSSRTDVPPPVIGLGLHALDGTHLWGSNTGRQDLWLDPSTGGGAVVLRIPQLPLMPGVFDLHAAVHDRGGGHTYDYRRRVLRFDVVPTVTTEGAGYVSLGGQWALDD